MMLGFKHHLAETAQPADKASPASLSNQNQLASVPPVTDNQSKEWADF